MEECSVAEVSTRKPLLHGSPHGRCHMEHGDAIWNMETPSAMESSSATPPQRHLIAELGHVQTSIVAFASHVDFFVCCSRDELLVDSDDDCSSPSVRCHMEHGDAVWNSSRLSRHTIDELGTFKLILVISNIYFFLDISGINFVKKLKMNPVLSRTHLTQAKMEKQTPISPVEILPALNPPTQSSGPSRQTSSITIGSVGSQLAESPARRSRLPNCYSLISG